MFELAAQTPLGVTIPPLSVIQAAVKNPIPKLTLPSLMETHRNEIVRKNDLEISQSLMSSVAFHTPTRSACLLAISALSLRATDRTRPASVLTTLHAFA
ncbi:hypothetical protein [Sporolactobacillus laevolacticus]|uniref:hypothetical protein n=1 Tax=Sporolactobacillus laevolacticus TaxID=33018 RepID=UPI001268581B|nr:hypothetical protein [Sporolactobacillus laevolacticus]